MFDGMMSGLTTAFMPFNLMMVVVGCFAGTFIGMLPGFRANFSDCLDDPYHLRP